MYCGVISVFCPSQDPSGDELVNIKLCNLATGWYPPQQESLDASPGLSTPMLEEYRDVWPLKIIGFRRDSVDRMMYSVVSKCNNNIINIYLQCRVGSK